MSLAKVADFPTGAFSDVKGACLRLAVKWAVYEVCGARISYFESNNDWRLNKEARDPGKLKNRVDAANSELPPEALPILLLKNPETGVEKARWAGAKAKHAEYAKFSEAAPGPKEADEVATSFVRDWSARIAASRPRWLLPSSHSDCKTRVTILGWARPCSPEPPPMC